MRILFKMEYTCLFGFIFTVEIILSHAFKKFLLWSRAPMSGRLCKSWMLPCTCTPFWSSGEREPWGDWKQMKRSFLGYLSCLGASALNYLCSHSQVSQFTTEILFILPLVFSYLFNTGQFTNVFLFMILLIFSFSAEKQLGIKSDLIRVS